MSIMKQKGHNLTPQLSLYIIKS